MAGKCKMGLKSDLNEEIRRLKTEGKSLRAIATALGVSHESVRKRLKNLEGKVSTIETERKLTASTIQNEKVSTAPNAHQSRASEESESIVNLIPSVETPSHTLTEGVNPSGNHSRGPLLGMKGVYQGIDSESGDLFEGIKVFLESNGIEVYRMNVEPEAYQARHNGQLIRIYVRREDAAS